MTKTRTCQLFTLGCKVNQYETQYVKEALEANGYHEAVQDEPVDLYLVNTCTVTMEGDAKSRQLIRRLHQRHPTAAILVMGCYATRAPDTVKRLPGVTQVITDKTRLAEELQPHGVVSWPRGIRRFDGHQRAFVKVQDGCLLNCSYCIIPKVRPQLHSRPMDEIVAEVADLVAGGCQEIVLTGVHLGHYGIDRSRGRPKAQWTRLWHLLGHLDRLPGDFRIRVSSLEAAEVRDDLVRVLAEGRRLVPHLHLCLQSGSDRILGLMKRRYRSQGFLERCRRLRQALDRPAFTTDVIVGFPGETEEDFAATCRVIQEVGFARLHVFSYSPRQGTPAATLADPVHPSVTTERRERLRDLERSLAETYCRSLLGLTLGVLVEGEDPSRPGYALGTSCRYMPVAFPGHVPALVGKVILVQAGAVMNGVIIGRPQPSGDPEVRLASPVGANPLIGPVRIPLPQAGATLPGPPG